MSAPKNAHNMDRCLFSPVLRFVQGDDTIQSYFPQWFYQDLMYTAERLFLCENTENAVKFRGKAEMCMKKKKVAWSTALAVLLGTVSVSAHPPVSVVVNGSQVTFDRPPIIVEDRTLVPMRKIFEALGARVEWDEPTQSITSYYGTDTLLMFVGQKEVYRNGEVVYIMDVPAQIMTDRLFVPVRAVAEGLSAKTAWDEKTYTVSVTGKDVQVPEPNGENSGTGTNTLKAKDGTPIFTVEVSGESFGENNETAKQVNASLARERQINAENIMAQYGDAAEATYEAVQAEKGNFMPWYYKYMDKVTAENNRYLSVLQEAMLFTGVRPAKTWTAKVYAVQTGQQVDPWDILPESRREVEQVVKQGFLSLIHANPSGFYGDAEKRLTEHMTEMGFYLTETGIVFFLNPDTIAPPEAGIVAFFVEYPY